ncbi:MAG: DUF1648 domain-containing protein [Bacteroidales bacterium]|jgi:uncharacterized membrane protein|nr:DUF1648 domain-containing protein [Bacteroidales bacterium]
MKIKEFLNSLTWFEYILEILSLILVILSIILFVIFWFTAPDIVPIHFNYKGIADGFGSKTTLIILPIITIIFYIGFLILVKFPHLVNLPLSVHKKNAEERDKLAVKVVRIMKPLICALFTFLSWYDLKNISQLENYEEPNTLFIVIMSLFFIAIILCLIFVTIKMKKIKNRGAE